MGVELTILNVDKTLFGVFQHSHELFSRDAREPIQELVDRCARFQILKQRAHRYSAVLEDPRATDSVSCTLDFRTIRPIQH